MPLIPIFGRWKEEVIRWGIARISVFLDAGTREEGNKVVAARGSLIFQVFTLTPGFVD